MRQLTDFALGLLAMAALTWFVAWWTVPLVAAGWVMARRDDRSVPLAAGAAGLLSWSVLLFLPSSPAAVGRLAEVAGAAMGTGPGPLLLLTLVYPALLAVAAASFTRSLLLSRRPR